MKRDAIWIGLALLFGLLALPPLVQAVGERTLGAYVGHGAGAGQGSFVGDFYAALAGLAPGALLLALGPAAVVVAWRLLRRLFGLHRPRRA